MSIPLEPEHIEQLKTFVDMCIANPLVLHQPEFAFVKKFIEHFGGKIPKADESPCMKSEEPKETKPEPEPESESKESDIERDTTGVIESDADTPHTMGDLTLEPTEEQIAESEAKCAEAQSAFIEEDYESSLKLYTDAILLNPRASLLYAKRARVFLLMNKPKACIIDCNRALEINPDSAAAYKFRGRAYHLLGKFEEAAIDLRLACKIDFDEQADEWLREVTPNARKIEEERGKAEREAKEKLERERQERLRNAREATKEAARRMQEQLERERQEGGGKAFQENIRTSQTESSGESAETGEFYKFLRDPDVLQGFQDPEITETFKDISANPTNILKYQNNPKIMAFINKIGSKFGGAGGMPCDFSGMMGGMPGFSSADATPTSDPNPNPKPKPQDDVGLD